MASAVLGLTPITVPFVPWVSAWVMSWPSLPMTARASTSSPSSRLLSAAQTVALDSARASLFMTETPIPPTSVPPDSAFSTGALTASKRRLSAAKVLFLWMDTEAELLSIAWPLFTITSPMPTPTPRDLAATVPVRLAFSRIVAASLSVSLLFLSSFFAVNSLSPVTVILLADRFSNRATLTPTPIPRPAVTPIIFERPFKVSRDSRVRLPFLAVRLADCVCTPVVPLVIMLELPVPMPATLRFA